MNYRIGSLTPSEDVLATGIVSGVFAGIVMAIVAMMHAALIGQGFLTPVKLVAAMWEGVNAMLGGTGTIVLGLLTHLIVAAILGVIFTMIIPLRATSGVALRRGIAFGILVWLVMTFIVTPGVDKVLRERVALSPTMWFIDHLVFGAFLSVVPRLRQTLRLRVRATEPELAEPLSAS